MKDSIMLTYLTDLSHNNDRQWYHAHKEEFLAAKTEFEGLVQELIYRIGKTDSSILNQNPRDLVYSWMCSGGSASPLSKRNRV